MSRPEFVEKKQKTNPKLCDFTKSHRFNMLAAAAAVLAVIVSSRNDSFAAAHPPEKKVVTGENVTQLQLLTTNAEWISQGAVHFSEERSDVHVNTIKLKSSKDVAKGVASDALTKTGLYDIFITPPYVMGAALEEDGWTDLTGFMKKDTNEMEEWRSFVKEDSNQVEEWSDILPVYKDSFSKFEETIRSLPVDGDMHFMYYRKDVLDHFDLEVPRTWEEYNAVANATHGQLFNDTKLSGSCVGRRLGCSGKYWTNLVLSSMTQTKGMESGSLFDTADMKPLLGEAFEQTLEWLEIQSEFGAPYEFENCMPFNKEHMNNGTCVLTYNWGDSFTTHMNEGTAFQKGEAELGVAMTPGSTRVLDRDTMKLVNCTEELCSDGWINRSPYFAFGGWVCAVNNYISPKKKALAAEFCAYASSRRVSEKLVLQNASTAVAGLDPFRESHLNVTKWTENGYDQSSVETYITTIKKAHMSKNAVIDIRFPLATEIYSLLDAEAFHYLNATRNGAILESDRQDARKKHAKTLTTSLTKLINEYDSKPSTKSPLLYQYQRLRNVADTNSEMNYLKNGVRYYGYFICFLPMVMAVVFATAAYIKRSTSVVKASQPLFLILLCAGVFIFSSSIFPMTIDDNHSSQEACSRACMAIPWLICLGWTMMFSALEAKLRRINLVVNNSKHFRSVKISEKDMMGRIILLFGVNIILMTLLTILDPLIWKREEIEDKFRESYGGCSVVDTDSLAWQVIIGFLGFTNIGLLIVANVQSYKARNIDTKYGESVYIGLIMISFLQVVLVGIPLFYIVHGNANARFFVLSSIVFIMSMAVLLLIFIPKFVRLYKVSKQDPTASTSHVQVYGLKTEKDDDKDIFKESKAVTAAREAYEAVWMKRINDLKDVVNEEGFDSKISSWLQTANIVDEKDEIVPVELKKSFLKRLTSGARIQFSDRNSSNGLQNLVRWHSTSRIKTSELDDSLQIQSVVEAESRESGAESNSRIKTSELDDSMQIQSVVEAENGESGAECNSRIKTSELDDSMQIQSVVEAENGESGALCNSLHSVVEVESGESVSE